MISPAPAQSLDDDPFCIHSFHHDFLLTMLHVFVTAPVSFILVMLQNTCHLSLHCQHPCHDFLSVASVMSFILMQHMSMLFMFLFEFILLTILLMFLLLDNAFDVSRLHILLMLLPLDNAFDASLSMKT